MKINKVQKSNAQDTSTSKKNLFIDLTNKKSKDPERSTMNKTKSLNEKLSENNLNSNLDDKVPNNYLNNNMDHRYSSIKSNNGHYGKPNSDYESDHINRPNLNTNNGEDNKNNNDPNTENDPEIQKSIDFISRVYALQQKSRLPPSIRKLYTSLSLYNNNNNNNT